MAPTIRFDPSSIDPRHRAAIIGSLVIVLLAIGGLLVANRARRSPEPPVVTGMTSPTATAPAQSPTAIAIPSETPSPLFTATLQPYTYVIQPGDTLLYIIQQFGYRDLAVVPEIIALNGMASENDLIAGETLLIPRQTPTVGPTFTPSPTLDPLITPPTTTATGTAGPTADPNVTISYSGCNSENRCASPDGRFWIHEVQAEDTIAAIAFAYDSTVGCILRENGLPNDPLIFQGQQIKVCILVTLTPTLTPTGRPDSTATPTPTPAAPALLAPAQNASISRNDPVILQWVPIRPLSADQSYLVAIRNLDTSAETRAVTRANSYSLPPDLQPGVGRILRYEWRVVVIAGSTPDSPPVSGSSETRMFTWGSP